MNTYEFDYEGAHLCMQTMATGNSIEVAYRDRHEFYERPTLEWIRDHAPRGETYFDIGAHNGNHAVYFGKWLADRVVCAEPWPHLWPMLKHNMTANGVSAYRLWQCGCADTDGEMPIKFHSHLTGEPSGEVTVPVHTVDHIWQHAERPVRFLKIDVDGMDAAVLRGAKRLIEVERPHISVEAWKQQNEVRALLAGYGYTITATFGPAKNPTYYAEPRDGNTVSD